MSFLCRMHTFFVSLCFMFDLLHYQFKRLHSQYRGMLFILEHVLNKMSTHAKCVIDL